MIKNRYSAFIVPLFVLIDIIIINTIIQTMAEKSYVNNFFLAYVNFGWLIVSYYVGFYKISRTTKGLRVLSLFFTQLFVFSAVFFTYFSLFVGEKIGYNQLITIGTLLGGVFVMKFVLFYALKIYREHGKNYRKVVFIGFDDSIRKVSKLFSSEDNFGFRILGFFSNREYKSKEYLGKIEDSFSFILENEIDEIYCSAGTLNKKEIAKFLDFANIHKKSIKLVPELKDLYRKNLLVEYYGSIPILKLKELPFEKFEVRFFKRIFDIIFSLFIIVFVLSWLIPILFLIVRLDSKGPLFFKQKRRGLQGGEFYCYKFRSMKLNEQADVKQVSLNDDRITKVGAFLRQSSIDELPQFVNVLFGDMSVVGPRPHMSKQSLTFEREVNNYILRNAVKPGITGLAQISGYRGEIKKRSDIENRVRLDIFYIENWSFFLDVKIIIKTVFNLFKGEEKAY
jgi:putative colanic acid biosynthesis UDP-glucose lipid carrier transferase